MTVAGDEQCSLLMLQCELTVLSQPHVPYCMKEGKIPVLIQLSTPYLHCTCTLKGWKNLAENKEKKDAALKMKEAAVWSNRRICNLQRKQSQAPSIATCCACDGNSNSGAKQKNLNCLWLFPLQSREVFFLKRKHFWVSSGVCAWRCVSIWLLWNTNSPGSLRCRVSKQKNLAILLVQGGAGQRRLCLSPFLNNRAHNVVLVVPRNWEFGVFNCLGLWGSFAFYFFLVYMALTVN